MRRAQQFSLESLESRSLLSNITSYPITLNPGDITTAGGKLWFSEFGGGTNAIGMLEPSNPGAAQAFSQGLSSTPGDITTGPDGNAWFTESSAGKIGMIITSGSTHPIQEFTLPSGATPQGITANTPTSTIWYTDPGNKAIGSIQSNNYVVKPEIKDTNGFIPGSQIVVGTDKDGTLWFTEYNSLGQYAIGNYDPVTNTFGASELLGSGQMPYGIATVPGGNIWFSEAVPNTGVNGFASSALGVITPSTPTPKEYAIPTTSSGAVVPFRIVEGPDGNIWYTGNTDSTIGMFNVTTQNFATENAPLATGETLPPTPVGITVGPDPDNVNIESIWFTDNFGAVDVKLLASQLVVTSPPPVSTTAGTGFSVGVTAYDSSGNIDPTYNGSVTLVAANNLGGSPSTFMATASQGLATVPVTLDTAGSYSLTARANGPNGPTETTPPISVNVTGQMVNPATQLEVYSQSTTSVLAGSPFSLVIEALTGTNALAASYSGTVTLTLASGPAGALGGTTIATASSGFASFPSVTLSLPGTYIIQATAIGLSSVSTTAITVPPQVQSAGLWYSPQKINPKTHKKIGKPVLIGYQFTFDTAMNYNSLTIKNDFLVQIYVPAKGRGKNFKPAHYQAISGFSLTASSTTVQVLFGTKISTTFKNGGQITLIGTGISSEAGALLVNNVPSIISKRGTSITLG